MHSTAPSTSPRCRRGSRSGRLIGNPQIGRDRARRAAATDPGVDPADHGYAAAELIALHGQFRRRHAALKLQQVERWRLSPGEDRTASMRLAAMMGLMVEQMREDIPKRLLVRFA